MIRMAEGAEGLAEAIERGVISADATRMYRQVLNENRALRAENAALRAHIAQIEAINGEYREAQIEALTQMMERGGKR